MTVAAFIGTEAGGIWYCVPLLNPGFVVFLIYFAIVTPASCSQAILMMFNETTTVAATRTVVPLLAVMMTAANGWPLRANRLCELAVEWIQYQIVESFAASRRL